MNKIIGYLMLLFSLGVDSKPLVVSSTMANSKKNWNFKKFIVKDWKSLAVHSKSNAWY
jgi:glutathione peroxidase-family protein